MNDHCRKSSIKRDSRAAVRRRARQPAVESEAEELAQPSGILALQGTIGNRSVTRLIQARLLVGPAHDRYEQEADRVAEHVLRMPAPEGQEEAQARPLVQREGGEEQEEEPSIRTKQLAPPVLPAIRGPIVQGHRLPDEPVNPVPTLPVPEEQVEVKIQARRLDRRAADGGFEVGGNLDNRLRANLGGGTPLSPEVRRFMEPRLGAEFGNVRVHSGPESVQLNRELQAQAFTYGSDIFLGRAGYDPGSSTGKQLLAHELVHVIQQGAAGTGRLQSRSSFSAQRAGSRGAGGTGEDQGGRNLWARSTGATSVQRKNGGPGAPAPAPAPADAKLQQEQKDYAKFVGSSYKFDNFTIGKNGKFDVEYQPPSKVVNITMKVKFDFQDEVWHFALFEAVSQWLYRRELINNVIRGWSGRYQFKNVRAPQDIWKKLNPVSVRVNVQPVDAGQHVTIQVKRTTKGGAQVSQPVLGGVRLMELFKNSDKHPAFNPGTAAGEVERVKRITPTVLFAHNSSAIDDTYQGKLQFLADYLKRINTPQFKLDIVGHASNTPDRNNRNQIVSQERADATMKFLQGAGLTTHTLASSGVGAAGAGPQGAWRKAVIKADIADPGWVNEQDVPLHEFGHMFGLGDEYHVAGQGPKATHYDLVKKAFGDKYAEQVAKRGDTDYASIMEGGSDIRIQHYVTFWDALCQTTLQKAAVPTPRFGHDDWKFIG